MKTLIRLHGSLSKMLFAYRMIMFFRRVTHLQTGVGDCRKGRDIIIFNSTVTVIHLLTVPASQVQVKINTE